MVHGRNSYKRSAALSQFVIHRSLCISAMQVQYNSNMMPFRFVFIGHVEIIPLNYKWLTIIFIQQNSVHKILMVRVTFHSVQYEISYKINLSIRTIITL